MASKCISKLARSIPATKYLLKEWRLVYRDTGVTEVDRVMGSIHSADPGVDRHHLISTSSYHTMKIHTLSFPTCGLTCSFQDFVDPCNCVDPQQRVVSYLLTRFRRSSNQNCCFWSIPFGCQERCGGVLMVGSLPSSSIVSPQRPPSGASISFLNGHVQVLLRLCSTTIWGQIDHMYIYRKTQIMHAILWCSESCDCKRRNALW